jgi:phospholipid transport system substrate-binding protein
MRPFTIITCITLLTLFGAVSVQADEHADQRVKLSATMESALDVVYLDDYQEYTIQERQEAVREVIERNYDLNVIIRRALARNWNLLTAEQQEQVSDLIDQLIVKTLVLGFEGQARPMIACGDVIVVTEKRMEIPVVISFPGGETYHVLYRFGRLKTGWQVYDIVAEDISIVSNYRQQFDDHFRKQDGAQLIEKLEKLLDEDQLDVSTQL